MLTQSELRRCKGTFEIIIKKNKAKKQEQKEKHY